MEKIIKNKILLIIFNLFILTIPVYSQSFTGWVQIPNTNNWIYQKNGQNYKGWINTNGWYFLEDNFIMATNKWIKDNNKWYYVGQDGKMLVNCYTPDGYFVNSNGEWLDDKVKVISNKFKSISEVRDEVSDKDDGFIEYIYDGVGDDYSEIINKNNKIDYYINKYGWEFKDMGDGTYYSTSAYKKYHSYNNFSSTYEIIDPVRDALSGEVRKYYDLARNRYGEQMRAKQIKENEQKQIDNYYNSPMTIVDERNLVEANNNLVGYYNIIDPLVYIRKTPDDNGEVIYVVNKQDVVEIESFIDKKWAVVKYQGIKGYIHRQYIKLKQSYKDYEEEHGLGYYKVIKDGAPTKGVPNDMADTFDILNSGDRVFVWRMEGSDYAVIEYNNKRGYYIRMEYLEKE